MAKKHATTMHYVVIWAALVGLTVLSWLLSAVYPRGIDVLLALLIASVKSALVLLFFMHLIEQRLTNAAVPFVCVGFVALLVGLVWSDVATRHTFPKGVVPDVTGK